MDILKESLDGKIFWCYVGDELPKEEIKKLVVAKQGFFVSIGDFDQLMVLLGIGMGLDLPYERIEPLAKERATKYRAQFDIVSKESKNMGRGKDAPSQKELEDIKQWEGIIEREGESWWIYEFLVQQVADSKEKEKIYKAGLEKFPQSPQLMGNYAIFLKENGEDYDKAERYYQKALGLAPEDANKNGNYAVFLHTIRKDYDKAERYYQKALKLDPQNTTYNGNYAIFLKENEEDYDKAERYYQKALELGPEDAVNNGSYAIFLSDIRKDYDKAERYYQKALELDPENANNNGNYANFLHGIRRDYDKAERYYKRGAGIGFRKCQ